MYTSLFLDIDNTLLDFNKAEAVAVRKVLIKYSLPSDDTAVQTYSKINQVYWERFERGEIPKSDIFEGRFKTLLEHYGEERDTKAISDDYCKNLSEGYFKVEHAEEILGYLKDKGGYLFLLYDMEIMPALQLILSVVTDLGLRISAVYMIFAFVKEFELTKC